MEKILIVDDFAANSRALALLLKSMGYQVTTAETGMAALQVLREGNIALMLLDIMMPDMTGLDVLKTVRADPSLHRLPVVMFSAADLYRDEAMQNGAQNFVIKGQAETFDCLCRVIEQQVGRFSN